ncbi:MAG: DUF5666 domain-containing protein [Shewanella sp.]
MNKLLVGMTTILLTACGGGGSSTDTTPTPTPPPTVTPTKISGTVTAVESNQITVNGYKIDIAGANILYADEPLNVSDVQKGMRVELITDSTATNKATQVRLDPSLVGEISSVNQNTIAVNGINLVVKPADATQYKVGDWVAVNGYPTVMGEWQVNSINLIPNFAFAEIEGRVYGLDTVSQQFKIGSAVIHYAAATFDDDDNADRLRDGAWVEVEGQQAGTVFTAHEIDIEDGRDNDAFDEMELEGTITWVNQDQSRFELNSRTLLDVTAQTRFEDGTKTDLVEGQRVDVDISADTNADTNRLLARKVDFETDHSSGGAPSLSHKFELAGTVTWVSNSELRINNNSFVIDARTQLDDGLTLEALDQQWLQIEGVRLADGQWLIKEIEREQNRLQLDLTGVVTADALWGYTASDSSLTPFEGEWVEVECQFDDFNIFNCRRDD